MKANPTWDEMKNKYPDEWLLITDFSLDDSGHIVAGIVNRHSKKKNEVYRTPALDKATAFRFTGSSSFAGLSSQSSFRQAIQIQ